MMTPEQIAELRELLRTADFTKSSNIGRFAGQFRIAAPALLSAAEEQQRLRMALEQCAANHRIGTEKGIEWEQLGSGVPSPTAHRQSRSRAAGGHMTPEQIAVLRDRHASGRRLREAEISALLSAAEEQQRLREAAEVVCQYDWSDNDDDAVAAVDALRAALAQEGT